MALIQSLVPVAAADPTALDTVLSRLLLAAVPPAGGAVLDDSTGRLGRIVDALTDLLGDPAERLNAGLDADVPPSARRSDVHAANGEPAARDSASTPP